MGRNPSMPLPIPSQRVRPTNYKSPPPSTTPRPSRQVQNEFDTGNCPQCGSSEKYAWYNIFHIGKPLGCFQPMCDRYWDKPKDYNDKDLLNELQKLTESI